MKYTDTEIMYREVPDETTLCINISNCPCHCPGCHSKELWGDVGTELDESEIDWLVSRNDGITCLCFMGHGTSDDFPLIIRFAEHIRRTQPRLKVALYSGFGTLPLEVMKHFDYIKLGPYIEEFGPLDREGTNQVMYQMTDRGLVDITYKFREHEQISKDFN